MAYTSWPGTLPQALLYEGLGEVLPFQAAVSDAGGIALVPQVIKVSKTGLHEFSGSMILSVAQKAIFKTFIYTTLGLCLPFTAPSTFTGDGIIRNYKLIQAPKYSGFADRFKVQMNLIKVV